MEKDEESLIKQKMSKCHELTKQIDVFDPSTIKVFRILDLHFEVMRSRNIRYLVSFFLNNAWSSVAILNTTFFLELLNCFGYLFCFITLSTFLQTYFYNVTISYHFFSNAGYVMFWMAMPNNWYQANKTHSPLCYRLKISVS